MGVRETTKNAKVAKVRLGDVLSVKARIGWQGLTQKEHQATGEYNLVTGTDFREGKVDFNRCVFVGKERYDQDPNIQLRDGDILITKDGTIGKVAVVEGMPRPATLNSGVFVLRDISGTLLVRYLYHYFLAPGFRRIVDGKLIGCTISHLNQKVLVNLPIPVRSLSDQKRIAEELDRICELKKNAEERLALMDQLVKSRFVEMFGDLQSNSKGWDVAPFEEAATIDGTLEKNFKRYADYPHIGIDSIVKGSGELVGYRTVSQDGVISGKYHFTPKHIIYSKIRPNLNKVALPNFEGLCSADAYAILPTDKSDRVYLAYVLRSQFFLDYIIPLSGRTGMPKANRKQIQGFELPLPPLALQREFVAFVAEVDKSKSVLRETVAQMETLYKAKLQEYFG